MTISTCELPSVALLRPYRGDDNYSDCFSTLVNGQVEPADYFQAFLTSWLFGLERRILAVAVNKPSSDTQAADLARGRIETFSAWRVEARNKEQLLLADFQGNTRTWLMAQPELTGSSGFTRLYFGSAVLAQTDPATGDRRISRGFRAILGFHRTYSRALLNAAVKRLPVA